MVRRNLRLVSLLAAILAAHSVPARAQTVLRYKFNVGEKLNYELTQKLSQKAVIQGKELGFVITQTMELSWTIKSLERDDKAKVAIRFERLGMKIDSPAGKLDYDSASGKDPEGALAADMGPALKAMKHLEFSMTMDALGKTADVDVPEKFAKALKDAASGKPGLGQLFSPEGLKRMLSQSALELPKDPVTKGKSWSQLVTSKTSFGGLQVKNVSTYDGSIKEGNRSLEKILLKPAVSMDADANAQIKIKDQKSNGAALFDNVAGRLVEVTLEQTLVLEAGQNTQEMQQTTSMKLKP
jgi:hypothetical protein